MKRPALRSVLGCAALLACALVAPAQDASPALTALLASLPADGPQVREALLRLGPADVAALCRMLVAPGSGDDTAPRLALHGLALAVGDPDCEAQRRALVPAVAAALRGSPPPGDPAFLIELLRLVGDAQAVEALGTLLHDERLGPDAARALVNIGGPDARRVLGAALPPAGGRCRLAIIDALGALGDTRCVPLLMQDAGASDRDLRLAAAYALARSGDPAARDVLVRATAAESWYERSRTTDFLLLYAAGLAARQQPEPAAAIYRELFRTRTSPADTHVRCAALHGLAESLGLAGLPDVVAALGDENPQVRIAAGNALVAVPGPAATQACLAEYAKAAPAVRAALLDVLARRGDPAGLPATLAALQEPDIAVRQAAIAAAATLGGERAVQPLIDVLAGAPDAVRDAARDALVRIPGPAVTARLGAALADVSPPVRIVLLDVLAARPAGTTLEPVFAAAADGDGDVRCAALRALAVLADAGQVPRLLARLAAATSDAEREAAGQAVSAAARRAPDRAGPADQVSAALRDAPVPVQAALLRALGRLGGPRALGPVLAAARGTQPELVEAALRALNDWPDAEPAGEVLRLAQDLAEQKHHVLALRAYVRLVRLAEDLPGEQRARMYAAGLEAARRPDEKKLILGRLGEVHDPASLAVLRPHLADAALRDEAAAAMVSVAEGFIPARWPDARAPLEELLAAKPPEAVRQRAAAALRRLEEFEGYITTEWWAAGPYTVPDKEGNALFDVPFPPEQPGAAGVEWRRQPPHRDGWFVELHDLMGGDHRVGYLFTRVYSPRTQKVRLELGSDDGIKVWLNGQVVHARNVLRGCEPASDRLEVTLNEGWNPLLMKVTNTVGGWAACARFRALDGSRIDDVRAEAGSPP